MSSDSESSEGSDIEVDEGSETEDEDDNGNNERGTGNIFHIPQYDFGELEGGFSIRRHGQ